MNPHFLYSNRLVFVAGTPTLLEAELAGVDSLARVLNVAIPADWPPGEYDRDALLFFREQVAAGGEEVIGWYSWYVITFPTETEPATLVAGAGFFGPPSPDGTVEIGYSVSEYWRRRGLATEIVATLVDHARQQPDIQRIIAHTDPDNKPSIGVLLRNGFVQVANKQPPKLCFE